MLPIVATPTTAQEEHRDKQGQEQDERPDQQRTPVTKGNQRRERRA